MVVLLAWLFDSLMVMMFRERAYEKRGRGNANEVQEEGKVGRLFGLDTGTGDWPVTGNWQLALGNGPINGRHALSRLRKGLWREDERDFACCAVVVPSPTSWCQSVWAMFRRYHMQ